MVDKGSEESSFQGSNRELFYVSIILIISLLSGKFNVEAKYGVIPLLVILAIDIYRRNKPYKTMKITAISILVLLYIIS